MIPIPISCISDFISPKANASEYTLIFSWRRISFRLRAASWIPVNPFGRSLTSLPLSTFSPFIFFFQRYNNCLDYIAFYIRPWRLETNFKIDRGVSKMLCTHRIFGDSVCCSAAADCWPSLLLLPFVCAAARHRLPFVSATGCCCFAFVSRETFLPSLRGDKFAMLKFLAKKSIRVLLENDLSKFRRVCDAIVLRLCLTKETMRQGINSNFFTHSAKIPLFYHTQNANDFSISQTLVTRCRFLGIDGQNNGHRNFKNICFVYHNCRIIVESVRHIWDEGSIYTRHTMGSAIETKTLKGLGHQPTHRSS